MKAKKSAHAAKAAELAQLNQSLNASDAQAQAWQAELTEIVQGKLEPIRQRLAVQGTAYLASVGTAAATAQAMREIPEQEDPRELKVHGALLPFARAATRLHAIESCAGRVTLSYQDHDGNVRQTHYDTAYDSDGRGEEWLADTYRVARELDGTKPALKVPAGVFKDASNQITIEFWAKGGSDLPKACVLLRAAGSDNAARLAIQLPNEAGKLVWEAGMAPAGGKLDRVEVVAEPRLYRERWTHWAFVKDADKGEMRIHANGRLLLKNEIKTDPKAATGGPPLSQSVGGIASATLGGPPGWSGRIAELRIWSAALAEREIEANSVLTLTGDEPGLVAYWPFYEAQGEIARDETGRGQTITTTGSRPAVCTAPIGRLAEPPAQSQYVSPLYLPKPAGGTNPPPLKLLDKRTSFNGVDQSIQLPTLIADFSEGFTIEARVRFDAFGWYSRIVDLGNGPDQQSIIPANENDSGRLYFKLVASESAQEILKCPSDLPLGQWVTIAATVDKTGTGRITVDGVEKAKGPMALPSNAVRVSNLAGRSNVATDDLFKGEMEFVRFYERTLTHSEISVLANGGMHTPAAVASQAPSQAKPSGPSVPAPTWAPPRLLPVVSAEYSRVRVDAQKKKSVMMLRLLAMATPEGVRLIDEQRIEELEMKWIGNAQVNPTLIGYIEGAPPLPSENLTEETDYNGATSVELIQSTDVEHSWTREQDASLGAETTAFIGVEAEVHAGIGVTTKLLGSKAGANLANDFANHWKNSSTVAASHGLMSSDRLELRGTQEIDARFKHLGKRFIPKNVGYALVVSGLADVFVSKLKRSGRMIGYQVLPVEGVPLDVNTITFMINPAYTMAGSLDGMTGSRATSDRFHAHVPDMRSQYGSLYPASYFRLKEAYDLKARIDEQDKLHQAYFNQFDASKVDETSLNAQVGNTKFDGGPVTPIGDTPGAAGDTASTLDKLIEEKEKQIETLKKQPANQQSGLKALENELDDLRKLKLEQAKKEQAVHKKKSDERRKMIEEKHKDLSAKANASAGFAGWQKKMEDLQVRAGKRNIANTYVWDGDGGLHAEEQQFASTVEHSVGGSFDLNFAIGGEGAFNVASVAVELNAKAKVGMTQTMTKTEKSTKGMELKIDLEGVESRNITDFRDFPVLPGEKVDRYRFMSFYLEGNTDHWHAFFSSVVDPEWLASNSEEARALRQAQNAQPNKSWRVFHRVTYVERPALMGFGRSLSLRTEAADDLGEVRLKLDKLAGQLTTLQNELKDKLQKAMPPASGHGTPAA